MLYFAYGSNLWPPRMQARVPSAQIVGRGLVHAYRLRFHKVGRDGTGKADLWKTGDPGDKVWGACYRIDPAERPLLDRVEDLNRGYQLHHLDVFLDRILHRAFTYRAILIRPGLRPAPWYAGLVEQGKAWHGIPR